MKLKKYSKSNRKTILFISLLVVSLLLGFVMYISYAQYRRVKTVDIIGGVVSLSKVCEYELGQSWDFDYTGGEQEFVVPCSGKYEIEVWGAQGGSANQTYIGGYGGYSTGNIILNNNQNLYINVGGAGQSLATLNGSLTGGYNGGGMAKIVYANSNYTKLYSGSGGGATHVSIKSGLLSSLSSSKSDIIIVSGGGGGAAFARESNYGLGGSGGGYIGVSGTGKESNLFGTGGTQSAPGYFVFDSSYGVGSFGLGASTSNSNPEPDYYYGGAGGGGYYGGGASGSHYTNGGGGGSGYIGNSLLTDKAMYCYNCTESNDFATKTISNTCHSSAPTENCSKEGNGYARITLVQYDLEPPTLSVNNNVVSIIEPGQAIEGIKEYQYYIAEDDTLPTIRTVPTGVISDSITISSGIDSIVYVRTVDINNNKGLWSIGYPVTFNQCLYPPGYTWNFDYTGDVQTFTAPSAGTYKLEVWGAQGGSVIDNGGYGAYSVGEIILDRDEAIYLNVGSQGGSAENASSVGGYNGGGTSKASYSGNNYYYYAGSGGGATHIAKTNRGILSKYSSYKTEVLIVAGGGGGGGSKKDVTPYSGGNAGGISGNAGYDDWTNGANGGTQTAAGAGRTKGSFGQGANSNVSGGGGGGWYGGSNGTYGSGGGGSSYIGNSVLTNKSMYCYNCTASDVESTKTISNTCVSANPSANCSKMGNGYAKITELSCSYFEDIVIDSDFINANVIKQRNCSTVGVSNNIISAKSCEYGSSIQNSAAAVYSTKTYDFTNYSKLIFVVDNTKYAVDISEVSSEKHIAVFVSNATAGHTLVFGYSDGEPVRAGDVTGNYKKVSNGSSYTYKVSKIYLAE